MSKPHKWAKEIKAWADGAEIETKYGEHDWEVEYYPNWHSDQVEYRIKPQPKEPQYLYVFQLGLSSPIFGYSRNDYSKDKKVKYVGKIKLETDND